MTDRRGRFLHTLRQAATRQGAAVMGVCNVTPDSFSDGGQFLRPEDARARVDALLDEGADLLDVGGESTRPGAPPVPADEQLRRVLPVIRYASTRACVSVDTTLPEVAEACLAAGASAVNDVSCLAQGDLARVAARADAAFVLMHARGPQEAMTGFSAYPEDAYGDIVADVLAEWRASAARAEAAGLRRDSLVFDPGLGFAKSARHSAELLRRLGEIVVEMGRTGTLVLVGASRKSFLVAGDQAPAPPRERLGASLAAGLWSVAAGAQALRVHDVAMTLQALRFRGRLEKSETERRVAHAHP